MIDHFEPQDEFDNNLRRQLKAMTRNFNRVVYIFSIALVFIIVFAVIVLN